MTYCSGVQVYSTCANAAIQFYLSRVHINKKSTLKDLFPSSPLARAAAPKAPQ